jgi:hypothetical protein
MTALADLGLPEIAVTVTETEIAGVPAELPAGRYLVRLTNEVPVAETPMGPESAGAGFLKLPDDLTADAFIGMMAAPMGGAEATPMDAAAATPVSEEQEAEMMSPPPWYYETTLAGGPYAAPGETRSAVIDLTAGEWIVWGESPGAPQSPVALTVTGEAAADQPVPEADVRIDMIDFAFEFPTPLTAGSHVVELVNVGEQPHFIGMGRVPDGTTMDDVMALFSMFENPEATPAPGALSFENLVIVLDTADQSAGVTAWYTVDLEPGTYLAVCFVPDPETGLPHAMLGMTQLVEVE